jgi:hypothetical protein
MRSDNPCSGHVLSRHVLAGNVRPSGMLLSKGLPSALVSTCELLPGHVLAGCGGADDDGYAHRPS